MPSSTVTQRVVLRLSDDERSRIKQNRLLDVALVKQVVYFRPRHLKGIGIPNLNWLPSLSRLQLTVSKPHISTSKSYSRNLSFVRKPEYYGKPCYWIM